MLVTFVEVLVTDHWNVQRGTRPHSHAVVVVGSGITCFNVQTARVAHHHGKDLAVRGVPSGHYSVRSDPGSDQRTQTGSDVAT